MRRPFVVRSTVSGERAFDDEHSLGPADVAPPQRDELASPQTGVRGDTQELAELAVLVAQRLGDLGRLVGPGDPPCPGLRCARERLDLLDGEDLDPAGAVLAALWRSPRRGSRGPPPAIRADPAAQAEVEYRDHHLAGPPPVHARVTPSAARPSSSSGPPGRRDVGERRVAEPLQ